MKRKALYLVWVWGLFYSFPLSAEENSQRLVETLKARDRVAARVIRYPADSKPSRNPVDDVRCAAGVYSFDCVVPAPVMKKPIDLIVVERPCILRNFLTPGWRCDEP